MIKWDHNDKEVLVYDEELGDFRVATPQEIIIEILSLQAQVVGLQGRAERSEARYAAISWQGNPDRSGGQFTDEEINRSNW